MCMRIEIIAINKIPSALLRELSPELEETFRPLIDGCSLGSPLGLPSAAYDARRGQYKAELILDWILQKTSGENKTLAITDVDIYVPGLNFVFGLASLGRAALVSICRLDPAFYGRPSNRELMWERTAKEAVHELGHVFGLDHCSNPKCVMRFSNSVAEVDGKSSEFCGKCWAKLFGSPDHRLRSSHLNENPIR